MPTPYASSRAGGTVNVTTRQKQPRNVVEVRDNGESISPTDLPHVFDRFYHGEKPCNREMGGSGFRLAIARGSGEAHDNNIQIESQTDSGAPFRYNLPG